MEVVGYLIRHILCVNKCSQSVIVYIKGVPPST